MQDQSRSGFRFDPRLHTGVSGVVWAPRTCLVDTPTNPTCLTQATIALAGFSTGILDVLLATPGPMLMSIHAGFSLVRVAQPPPLSSPHPSLRPD